MSRLGLVALGCLGASGCHLILGIGDFSTKADGGPTAADGATGDGPHVDAMVDAVPADAQACFGSLASFCLSPLPSAAVAISGPINTDTDPRCTTSHQACMIAGKTIAVTGATRVTGSRPLVLVASDAITVDAAVDASSTHNNGIPNLGPGASMAPCSSSVNGTGISTNGGGGGAGGSFGDLGAVGGLGSSGGAGGTPASTVTVATIRAGCSGGKGADGTPGSGGMAGPAGGAIALIAGTAITIGAAGAVFASGGGGGEGNVPNTANRGAGGGGGSGGLIVLDAPSITSNGILASNGGGGGGGGDCCIGFPGGDGTTTQYNVAAAGGLNEGGNHGGKGGAGQVIGSAAVAGGAPGAGGGGGGGGGGVGIIWVHGAFTGTMISPAIQPH